MKQTRMTWIYWLYWFPPPAPPRPPGRSDAGTSSGRAPHLNPGLHQASCTAPDGFWNIFVQKDFLNIRCTWSAASLRARRSCSCYHKETWHLCYCLHQAGQRIPPSLLLYSCRGLFGTLTKYWEFYTVLYWCKKDQSFCIFCGRLRFYLKSCLTAPADVPVCVLNCTTSEVVDVGDLSWADDPQLLGAGAGGSVVTSGHVSRGRGVTPGVVTQCEETCVRASDRPRQHGLGIWL